jgi:hypothetical protein
MTTARASTLTAGWRERIQTGTRDVRMVRALPTAAISTAIINLTSLE